MGFKPVAYRGLETGDRDRVSYVLNQDHINLVITSPLGKNTDIGQHIDRHGDGIRDVAFTVDDSEKAWKESLERGAKSAMEPKEIKDSNGESIISAIKTFGDTIHTFVERHNYSGSFLPGYENIDSEWDSKSTGLVHIDHIVGNQPDGVMYSVCDFYEKVFGWHRFWTVDDKDISTEYSALRSIVMANDNEKIKHQDNNLQTLFYPEDLERKGRALKKDTKRILDEKGTNTLHLSFGCLEWLESKNTPRNAPLLLLQVKLSERPTSKGPEYFIESTEGELFTNLPLSKKLLNDLASL